MSYRFLKATFAFEDTFWFLVEFNLTVPSTEKLGSEGDRRLRSF